MLFNFSQNPPLNPKEPQKIIQYLLESKWKDYEKEKILYGGGLHIKDFIKITHILGFEKLRDKAIRYYQSTPIASPIIGTLTNIELKPDDLKLKYNRNYQLPNYVKIEEEYPLLNTEELISFLQNWFEGNKLWEFALNGKYEEALSIAMSKGDWEIHCIAATQIIRGDFDLYQATLEHIKEDFFRKDCDLILSIEYYRRGRYEEAFALLPKDLNNQKYYHIHLALGYSGRLPWMIYPYDDY
jgi:hypothetical protein